VNEDLNNFGEMYKLREQATGRRWNEMFGVFRRWGSLSRVLAGSVARDWTGASLTGCAAPPSEASSSGHSFFGSEAGSPDFMHGEAYHWNSGRIRRYLARLLGRLPSDRSRMGGPSTGRRYLFEWSASESWQAIRVIARSLIFSWAKSIAGVSLRTSGYCKGSIKRSM